MNEQAKGKKKKPANKEGERKGEKSILKTTQEVTSSLTDGVKTADKQQVKEAAIVATLLALLVIGAGFVLSLPTFWAKDEIPVGFILGMGLGGWIVAFLGMLATRYKQQ